MGTGGEHQAGGRQPGRVRPAESQEADRATHTSVLVCRSSRVQHCKCAWSELCAVVDKLFLLSESVCLMLVSGEQGQSVPFPNGSEESHQTRYISKDSQELKEGPAGPWWGKKGCVTC